MEVQTAARRGSANLANLAILAKPGILGHMSDAPLSSSAPGTGTLAELAEVSSSVLKNKFSEVARRASKGPLAVTRHNRREFVILSAEQYEALQQSRRAPLADLAAEFDALVAAINTPDARHAASALFAATPAALGKAALKARIPRKDA